MKTEENKIILVNYIDIRLVNPKEIGEFINKVKDRIKLNSKKYTQLIIPIYGESRVECINPLYITDSELIKKHERLMSTLHENLNILKNE